MPAPLSRIGNYRVVRVLGEGGMGTVYEGVHDEINRRAAIKVLHPEYARDPEIVKRFLNEARAVNIATHPGLVQISECGQAEDGTAYLVMEFLDGETLGARLKKSGGKLTEAKAVRFLGQLASALAAAHACGIVHRDLKPGNVMLVRDPAVPGGERVKLVDFGIAKLSQQVARTDASHTRTGLAMGTPVYMAPEQCLGAAHLDGKADVYSLGVMLFEMLAGEPPFVSDVDLALLNMHISKVPPPLQKLAPTASHSSAKLVKRMLSKSAVERPPMSEVVRLLQAQEAALPKEPEPIFEPEENGETRVVPRDSAPTFLRSGEQVSRRGRWRLRAVTSVGLGFAAIVVVWGYTRSQSTAPRVTLSNLTTAATELQQKSDRAVKPQTNVAVEQMVSLLIKSQPAGAAVVRLADGQVLGITPWHSDWPAQRGEVALELRLAGYRPQSISIPLDHTLERSEVLVAEASAKKLRPPARMVAAAEHKQKNVPAVPLKVTVPPKSPEAKPYDPANRIID